MPFVSESQRRYMYAKHPDIAAEFQAATPKDAMLPEKVDKKARMGAMQRQLDKGAING